MECEGIWADKTMEDLYFQLVGENSSAACTTAYVFAELLVRTALPLAPAASILLYSPVLCFQKRSTVNSVSSMSVSVKPFSPAATFPTS